MSSAKLGIVTVGNVSPRDRCDEIQYTARSEQIKADTTVAAAFCCREMREALSESRV